MPTITIEQAEDATYAVMGAIFTLDRERTYREIVDSLRFDVFPVWRKEQFAAATHTPGLFRKYRNAPNENTQKALSNWAKKFYLTKADQPVNWALEWGRRFCEIYGEQELNRIVPLSPEGTEAPTSSEPVGFYVWLPIPRPDASEKWSGFKTRALAEFRRQLRMIHDTASVLRDPPHRSTYRMKRQPAHYIWFVLYQCAGWSYTKIAEAYGETKADAGDESTIGHGVRKVATEIGVTLRKLAPKKPRKIRRPAS